MKKTKLEFCCVLFYGTILFTRCEWFWYTVITSTLLFLLSPVVIYLLNCIYFYLFTIIETALCDSVFLYAIYQGFQIKISTYNAVFLSIIPISLSLYFELYSYTFKVKDLLSILLSLITILLLVGYLIKKTITNYTERTRNYFTKLETLANRKDTRAFKRKAQVICKHLLSKETKLIDIAFKNQNLELIHFLHRYIEITDDVFQRNIVPSIKSRNEEIMLILMNKLTVLRMKHCKESILHLIIKCTNSLEIIKLYFIKIGNLNELDEYRRNGLFYTILKDNYEQFNYMLPHSNIYQIDRYKTTLLHIAVVSNNSKYLKVLKSKSQEEDNFKYLLFQRDVHNFSPLYYAISYHPPQSFDLQIEIIQLLLDDSVLSDFDNDNDNYNYNDQKEDEIRSIIGEFISSSYEIEEEEINIQPEGPRINKEINIAFHIAALANNLKIIIYFHENFSQFIQINQSIKHLQPINFAVKSKANEIVDFYLNHFSYPPKNIIRILADLSLSYNESPNDLDSYFTINNKNSSLSINKLDDFRLENQIQIFLQLLFQLTPKNNTNNFMPILNNIFHFGQFNLLFLLISYKYFTKEMITENREYLNDIIAKLLEYLSSNISPTLHRKYQKMIKILIINGLNLIDSLIHPLFKLFCDGMNDIPLFIQKDISKLKIYFYQLLQGRSTVQRMRAILVGKEEAGKTTLIRSIMQSNNINTLEEKTSNEVGVTRESTDGIEINVWIPKDQSLCVCFWDFAGQPLYYSTHQFFISQNALYLIVFDLRLTLNHTRITRWLNSIQAQAPGQKVMLVATHLNGVMESKLSTISSQMEKLFNIWSSSIRSIDCISLIRHPKYVFWPVELSIWNNNQRVNDLSNAIINHIGSQVENTNIPTSYLDLLNQITELRKSKPYITWLEFVDLCSSVFDVSIFNNFKENQQGNAEMENKINNNNNNAKQLNSELHSIAKVAAKYFHEWGEILYYPNDVYLRDYVVLEVRFLIRLFKTIISFRHLPSSSSPQITPMSSSFSNLFSFFNPDISDINKPNKNIISEEELFFRWENELNLKPNDNFRMILLRLVRDHFQIIIPWKDSKSNVSNNYIIPSQYFPQNDVDYANYGQEAMEQWTTLFPQSIPIPSRKVMARSYSLPCIPEGFLSRLFIIISDIVNDQSFLDVSKDYFGIEIDPNHIWPQGFILSNSAAESENKRNGEIQIMIFLEEKEFSEKGISTTLWVWCYPLPGIDHRSSNQPFDQFISKIFLSIERLFSNWYPFIWNRYQSQISVGVAKPRDAKGWDVSLIPRSDCVKMLLKGDDFTSLPRDKEDYPLLSLIPEFIVTIDEFEKSSNAQQLDLLSDDQLALIRSKQSEDCVQKTKEFGKYFTQLEFIRYLAEGAFGVVFEAIWQSKYHIAVKEAKHLSNNNNNDPSGLSIGEVVSSFLSEVKVQKNLNHPNVVKMLFYYFKPAPIIGLELIENCKDLDCYMKDPQLQLQLIQLSWPIVIKIALDTARGMHYLHSLSPPILHNDLRPPNILILNLDTSLHTPTAKITDLGNSILYDSSFNKQQEFSKKNDISLFGTLLGELILMIAKYSICPIELNHLVEYIGKEESLEWISFSHIVRTLEKCHRRYCFNSSLDNTSPSSNQNPCGSLDDDHNENNDNDNDNVNNQMNDGAAPPNDQIQKLISEFESLCGDGDKDKLLFLLKSDESLQAVVSTQKKLYDQLLQITIQSIESQDFHFIHSIIDLSILKINQPVDNELTTLIHISVVKGTPAIVKLLLEHSADVNARTLHFIETPLLLAVSCSHQPHVALEIAKILIKFEANVNCVSKNQSSPLIRATRNGLIEVVKILIAAGANVNYRPPNSNLSALFEAQHSIPIMELLLLNGARVYPSFDSNFITSTIDVAQRLLCEISSMSIGRRKEVQGLINFINSLTTNQFIYFHKSFSFLHIGKAHKMESNWKIFGRSKYAKESVLLLDTQIIQFKIVEGNEYVASLLLKNISNEAFQCKIYLFSNDKFQFTRRDNFDFQVEKNSTKKIVLHLLVNFEKIKKVQSSGALVKSLLCEIWNANFLHFFFFRCEI